MEKKQFKITFITEMLGTVPKNKEIYNDFVIEKAKKKGIEIDEAEEIETIEEVEEKAWTGFHSDETGILIYDYMIKGNIKANIETLVQSGTIKKITAYRKAVDRLIFVYPRTIHFMNGAGPIKEPHGDIERPLRASTAQGERVALTKSDFVRVGTFLKFEICMLKNPKISWDIIEKCLDYGQYYGLGQWRGSGGYGRYEWDSVS